MTNEFEDNMYTGTGGKFWKPTDIGDSVQGKLIAIEASQYKEGGRVFVLQTDDGEIRLPERKAMMSNLDKLGAEVGDTIFIKLTGWSSKKYYGKAIALYGVAVRKATGQFVNPKTVPKTKPQTQTTEADKKAAEENMVADEEEEVVEEKPKKKKKKDEAEAPKAEVKEEPKKEEPKAAPSGDKMSELKKFVAQIMKFEPEMPLEQLDGYINKTRKYDIDPKVAAELCGLVIENGIVKSPAK